MKNKWLIALSAVGIHISIGSVYAWSVLTKPIMHSMGITLPQVTWAFSIAILFLGLSAGFLGTFIENCGPRIGGLLSSLFFCSGLIGTGFAIHYNSIYLLYLSYGVIGGIGLGIGYIAPVATLVKYFPRARGFATGLAIMGFGFASLIAAPLMQYLVQHYGLVQNFFIIAGLYAIIMIASSLYIAPPTTPLTLKDLVGEKHKQTHTIFNHQFTAHEAMKTWHFYALWWIFFINITCGIALLAVASPMAQDIVKMTPAAAASMVGIIGLTNGFGRIIWSSCSDFIGRKNTYILFFIIEIFAFYFIGNITDALLFQILLLLIVSCYGGGFACMPAYLSDLFGTYHLSAIHGRILTAWGAAGIVGPLLLAFLRNITNSYTLCLYIFVGLFILNLCTAIILKRSAIPNLSASLRNHTVEPIEANN